MSSHISRRYILNFPFLFSWTERTPYICRRHQSSYRRTIQRLRVKPDASFLPAASQTYDHIIYNPPSSAPNIYHTPTKFLPPNDVRRQLRTARSNNAVPPQRFPLLSKSVGENKKILNQKDIDEMRSLRAKDPVSWSRQSLAKHFGCNPMFVAQVCEASLEKKGMQLKLLEAVKSTWGKKRTIAREERSLRKELWAKDQ